MRAGMDEECLDLGGADLRVIPARQMRAPDNPGLRLVLDPAAQPGLDLGPPGVLAQARERPRFDQGQ